MLTPGEENIGTLHSGEAKGGKTGDGNCVVCDVVMMGAAIISAVWIKTIRGEGFLPLRQQRGMSRRSQRGFWGGGGVMWGENTEQLGSCRASEGCQPNTPAGPALRKTSSNVTI